MSTILETVLFSTAFETIIKHNLSLYLEDTDTHKIYQPFYLPGSCKNTKGETVNLLGEKIWSSPVRVLQRHTNIKVPQTKAIEWMIANPGKEVKNGFYFYVYTDNQFWEKVNSKLISCEKFPYDGYWYLPSPDGKWVDQEWVYVTSEFKSLFKLR
jgi:hypothetical protein